MGHATVWLQKYRQFHAFENKIKNWEPENGPWLC